MMHVIETVPLIKLPSQNPQILSYFSARDLPAGSLVCVPLGRRSEKAIVIETHEVKNHKIEIKEAGFELKPIKKILSSSPLLTANQIKLALWLAQYYFAPAGVFLKTMIPKTGIKNYDLRIKNNTKQTLIIVPTVAQIETVQKNYLTQKIVIIHSGLKVKMLNENWQKIASGRAETIIRTRLAAFAPFVNLKEIIIEDETDPGHRSWDMFPHYRVHEIGHKLADIFGAKLTLKSEVPSIESNFMGPMGPIRPISPIKTNIVDLRQELRDGNFSIFSRQLQDSINRALDKKQQIILFLNRRGQATFVLCRDCGYTAKCPSCDAPLTYHLAKTNTGIKPILICHHCGQKTEPPTLCPKCQGLRIKAFGSGTQRVQAEAQKLFKDARILRLDSDEAPTLSQAEKIISEFKEKKADILIGTQMILNLDLPPAALVAIISADTLMHLPDFRSDERIFQTIAKLRKLTFADFIIQTYNPQSEALNLAVQGDFKTFYDKEIETRKILKYPPFSQIIKLVFRHRDPKRAGSEAKILKAKLTQQLKTSTILSDAVFEISEAVPAFIAKQKGRYVWQIIIKAKPYWLVPPSERPELLKLRNKILSIVPYGWEIEIDPETLL